MPSATSVTVTQFLSVYGDKKKHYKKKAQQKVRKIVIVSSEKKTFIFFGFFPSRNFLIVTAVAHFHRPLNSFTLINASSLHQNEKELFLLWKIKIPFLRGLKFMAMTKNAKVANFLIKFSLNDIEEEKVFCVTFSTLPLTLSYCKVLS